MKDYDIRVPYHPDSSNVVADGLSRMTMRSMYHVEECKKDLVKMFKGWPVGCQIGRFSEWWIYDAS